jgi:hypothetical protein
MIYEQYLPLSSSNEHNINIGSNANITLNNNYYTPTSLLSTLFQFFHNNATTLNNYYDLLRLDETSDSSGNLRHSLTTKPFRLVKGILNQHVTDLLQCTSSAGSKLIFLNYKITNSGELTKDKELIPETLWGFRQKKYKRIKKFNFKPQAIYDPVTLKIIGFNSVTNNQLIDIAGVDVSNVS